MLLTVRKPKLFAYASLFTVLLFGYGAVACHQRRPPARYLIPYGYVGWVEIKFNEKGAPPVMQEDGFRLFVIPAAGSLKVSSEPEYGWAPDEYYYVKAGGERSRIPVTTQGRSGMVWGGQSVGQESPGTSVTLERFFVGSEAAWEQQSARQ